MFDLRLLGVSRQLAVTEMAANPAFRLELLLIALTGLNAAMFHTGPCRSGTNWNQNMAIPAAVKVTAVLCLVLWVGVIACGRLLAYLQPPRLPLENPS